MQRKHLFLIVSAISAIVGISLIFYAATKIEPAQIRIRDITSEMVGSSVTAAGFITLKTVHPDGHIFLTLSDDNQNKIAVPLFAGFVSELRSSRFNTNRLQKGTELEVTGIVDEYKDQLQIIPRKSSDIKILGD